MIKRINTILFLLSIQLWALTAPRMVIMPVQTRKASTQEAQILDNSMRLELQKMGLFRILNHEETAEKLQKMGVENMPRCFTDKCRKNLAQNLQINYSMVLDLAKHEEKYSLQVEVFSGQHGALLESNQYSIPIQIENSLVVLGKYALEESFGIKLPAYSPVEKVSVAQHIPQSNLWVGLASMGTVAAVAAYKQAGIFLLKKDNRDSDGFEADYSTKHQLSAMRGFFASPKPHARIRALGGAGVAMNAQNGSDIINPAGLTKLNKREISFATSPLPGGGHQMFTQWASLLHGGSWWSQQVHFEGDDLASEMSLSTNIAADLGYYSSWLVGIHGAIGIKGYFIQAGQNGVGQARSSGYGMGYGLDLSLQWELSPQTSFAMMVEDFYSDIFYHNTLTRRRYSEDLPWLLTVGAFHKPFENTGFYMDWRMGNQGLNDRLMAGIEHNMWELLALRAGVHQVLGSHVRLLSLGAALHAKYNGLDFSVHYAWESAPQIVNFLASKQILTLNLRY